VKLDPLPAARLAGSQQLIQRAAHAAPAAVENVEVDLGAGDVVVPE
jgi:hypothetical protein